MKTCVDKLFITFSFLKGVDVNLYVIVPMYNVESWIGRNVAMLKKQFYSDFHCMLIDDMSADGTFREARREIAGDSRFEIIGNTTRKFALRNISEAISFLSPKDDDALVLIDGDDSFLHSNALKKIVNAYESSDCLLTYGSHTDKRGRRGDICRKYPDDVVQRNSVRNHRFLGAHPRTFKYKLWRQVETDSFCATQSELDAAKKRAFLRGQFRSWYYWKNVSLQDIHDETGRFFRRCYDKAILYPMFEMAGSRVQFIEDLIYCYNSSNLPLPYDKDKIHISRWLTRCIRSIVKAKPCYRPIF